MTLLFIYASIAIFVSFLCSILEAVFLSITPTYLDIKKKEGAKFAFTLSKLKANIDIPLIAILTLNTISHTVGAILVGVQSEQAFGSGTNVVGIVSAVMTILILIVSEIIPKTIGSVYWIQLAKFTSVILPILIFPLKWSGLLWLMQITTKLIGKKHHGSILTREDFSIMAEIAKDKGVFEESESKVIQNLLNFKKILSKDIMTPRTVMSISPEDQTLEEYYFENKNSPFSRIPVYKDSMDNITGYILKDDVLKYLAEDSKSKRLSELKRKILIVNNNINLPSLFEIFIDNKEHIALIADEYGTINGLITMEDVIETLLGLEILDEQDTDTDMQQLARNKWKERAKKYGLIDDLK